MALSTTVTSYADGTPGGNVADPVVRAVDIAKPAVVRIFTTVDSRLTVHFAQNNDVTFPLANSGNGTATPTATTATATSYPLTLSGSGTFITSNGDILTADHVVNPPKDQTLAQFLYAQAAQDVANYINRNVTPGSTSVTATQVTQQLATGLLQSTPIYDKVTSEAFLSTDYTGPLVAPTLQDVPSRFHAIVDKIESESVFDQKDVAIIHASFSFDTPSVQLGNSSNVQQQDTLTIIGFPGNGDVSTKPTDLLTSSVNKINVSSIKTTDSGAPVIQVGGNVEHGDSGGPALDANGTVVGIVSFGLGSPDSPNGLGGTSFLQAGNSAADLVQSLKLNTTPGPFEQLWSQAFSDYSASTPGHWHKAQQEFEQLTKKYTSFAAVTPYLDYARTQADVEQGLPTPTPTAQPTPKSRPVSTPTRITAQPIAIPLKVWAIGIAALAVIVLLVVFGAVMRRRKKKVVGTPLEKKPQPSPQQNQQKPADVTATTPAAVATKTPPPPVQSFPTTPQSTLNLRVWPCGHMNRTSARFCSVCGEPAPEQPTSVRPVEQ
ncbi:MAG TPA: serine protease [Ktedonobacteraceae bacterium]|nr:serine protease [Ktedonobacteraceae bacterium]